LKGSGILCHLARQLNLPQSCAYWWAASGIGDKQAIALKTEALE
jgi:hypothetical protein